MYVVFILEKALKFFIIPADMTLKDFVDVMFFL